MEDRLHHREGKNMDHHLRAVSEKSWISCILHNADKNYRAKFYLLYFALSLDYMSGPYCLQVWCWIGRVAQQQGQRGEVVLAVAGWKTFSTYKKVKHLNPKSTF